MEKLQSLANKKGEVSFRRWLFRRFPADETLWDLPPFQTMLKNTENHRRSARTAFEALAARGIPFTPYLDLGAAACVRSLVLENEFSARGSAGDLSFDALNFAQPTSRKFRYKKLPMRVVFDLYRLPFVDQSFSFVFSFQTLHHLPDPRPVFRETIRVLKPGGCYYLGEEPVKQIFNLNLWRRGQKRTWYEKILMAIGLLPFITTIGKEEITNGLLEESFSLGQWREFLSAFDEVSGEIIPFKIGPKVRFSCRHSIGWKWRSSPLLVFLARFFLFFLGGGINALCRKKDHFSLPASATARTGNLYRFLACPQCPTRPPLIYNSIAGPFHCPKCGQKYFKKAGIVFLLPAKLGRKLYPNEGFF